MKTAVNKDNPDYKLNITQFLMTKNMWEFFVTDNKHDDDIVEALVMGFETELGDISLKEIIPHTIVNTKDLTDVMPPQGFEWEDTE